MTKRQIIIFVIILGFYILMFFLLFRIAGAGIAALSLVPVAILAWMGGVRSGLIAGLSFNLLHVLLFNLLPNYNWFISIREGGGPGIILLIVVGVIVGYLHDLNKALKKELSERKQLEAEKEKLYKQLIQSEKMAATGQLAGGIAHELNNPLGVILGFAQSIVKMINEDNPLYMPLKSIERETIRCKKLVGDLLTFSQASKTEKEIFSINELIEQTLSLVESQAKVKNVQIT